MRLHVDVGAPTDLGAALLVRHGPSGALCERRRGNGREHGQRLLVLERNGVRTRNLVWKDTALIPVGATVDLLVEISNPGDWMLHCHVAEHLEAGMKMKFTVNPSEQGN